MENGNWGAWRSSVTPPTAQRFQFDDDREAELRGISSLGTM
jgi:hypothetical protein